MQQHARTLARLTLALTVAAPAAAQTTWVVDDNGTGDFVHIQDAVNAAQDGDVISVLDGGYAGFTINAKSLVVVGVPGANVRVAASVVVRNLGAGQRVELDHLRLGETFVQGVATVRVDDCAGSVRIVDCVVFSGGYSYATDGLEDIVALACRASDDVGVLRCSLIGGDPNTDYEPYSKAATAGLFASMTRLTITDSTLVGGDGIFPLGIASCGGPGAPGAVLRASSTLECLGTTFDTGPWGWSGPGCFIPRPPGVSLDASVNAVWKRSTANGVAPTFPRTQIAAYCFGTFEECPCGNNGRARAGCEVSYGTGGVELTATGTASVSADTVTLNATGLNPNATPPALFIQGGGPGTTGGMGAAFNDGLDCVGGAIRRLKGVLAVGGSMSLGFGVPGDTPVSVLGLLGAGGATRYYQVWFRNHAPQFCTSERFNQSNALEITWLP